MTSLQIQSVAIIGAEPSGVATAKLLQGENHFSEIVVYDQRNNIGVIWQYEDPMFSSSVYVGLESNIPRSIMEYSNYSFPSGTPVLPGRQAFREYIQNYAHDIKPLVKLRHKVMNVLPLPSINATKWEIEVKDLELEHSSKRTFDAVVVANGRYDKVFYPTISGLDDWSSAYPEAVLHSKTYRDAAFYQDKRVLVVGYSASGTDITDQLKSTSRTPVLVSRRGVGNVTQNRAESTKSDIKMVPEIESFVVADRAVRFIDETLESKIDAVIFCTGYVYDYPFLSAIPSFVDGRGNQDTYQHIFWTSAPSLAFSLLPFRVTAFPLGEAQAAVIARIWSGRLKLPSAETMAAWVSKRRESCSTAEAFHQMGYPSEVDYINEMLDWCLIAVPRKGLANDGQGFLPSHWTEKKRWLRRTKHGIRDAAIAKGHARYEITTPEQLEFYYKDPSIAKPSSLYSRGSNVIKKASQQLSGY